MALPALLSIRVVTVSTSTAVTNRALLAENCGFEQQSLLCLMSGRGFLLVLGVQMLDAKYKRPQAGKATRKDNLQEQSPGLGLSLVEIWLHSQSKAPGTG